MEVIDVVRAATAFFLCIQIVASVGIILECFKILRNLRKS